MSPKKPVLRMTPELLNVARDAYYAATKAQSVKADLDGMLVKVGNILLDAYVKKILPAKGGA